METKVAIRPAMTIENNLKDGILPFLGTPKGNLGQIELLVIVTAILLLFLVTFGSCRRPCSGSKFWLIIFTAYTLSTCVFTYALGLMDAVPFCNELFPVWAAFLLISFESTDSTSAYSLEDNEQWKRYNSSYITL